MIYAGTTPRQTPGVSTSPSHTVKSRCTVSVQSGGISTKRRVSDTYGGHSKRLCHGNESCPLLTDTQTSPGDTLPLPATAPHAASERPAEERCTRQSSEQNLKRNAVLKKKATPRQSEFLFNCQRNRVAAANRESEFCVDVETYGSARRFATAE